MSLQLDAISFRNRLNINFIDANGVEYLSGAQDAVLGDINSLATYPKLTAAQQTALQAYVAASIAPGGNQATKNMVITFFDVVTGNFYAIDGDTGVRTIIQRLVG